jgi:hypothetical protein
MEVSRLFHKGHIIMATINVKEIREILIKLGRADVTLPGGEQKIEFLEIIFENDKNKKRTIIDEDYVNKVISVETHDASGVIIFDEFGYLKSIDFS